MRDGGVNNTGEAGKENKEAQGRSQVAEGRLVVIGIVSSMVGGVSSPIAQNVA